MLEQRNFAASAFAQDKVSGLVEVLPSDKVGFTAGVNIRL